MAVTMRSGAIPKQRLHHRITMAMEFAEMGPSDLAEALGVHRNSVSAWINGRGKPKPPTLIAIASVTDVDLEWLVSGKVPPIGPGELVSFRSRWSTSDQLAA
jgi:transcriptional regulator with XRE-family HTH domain